MSARLRPIAAVAAVGVVALALAGCVPNPRATGASTALDVKVADDSCEVSASTAKSGTVTFTIANTGTDVNEFEILADDKLRIVGEKENITPGQTVSYVAQLNPGTYYTACKFQQVGQPIGLASFTVSGEEIESDASEKKQISAAVTNYVAYIKSQVGALVPATKAFTDAYRSGDDATARQLFASTRVAYERIEPTAEAFGDLDPKIDYREVDAVAEGLDWTGFHRIEKDLWPPAAGDKNSDGTDALTDWTASTPAERATYADGLVADVDQLSKLVGAKDFTVGIADISNGAIGLLDEVATGKIEGEEDWWSHTDLTDFAANVEGAQVAYGIVRDIAKNKGSDGAKLVKTIDARFTDLETELAKYGSIEAGFTPYDEVTDSQRKELSDAVNALGKPLSQLTHTVLGVKKA
ncbi:imelysin family protein [Schumannella luteola]|uniref:Iron uptake system component EfeO n=1 Tax=Schumannella luteola TaxID=472059 RepID=A0A852YEB0_9MICO|nr:iron uptake system protein EfeO [Schumannella luteola]NYG99481.1 iron uptake system component EfeO [Schumannella luteola]TPX03807.1 peptidase M75 family protein [Schumannella luteola]